MSCDLFSMELQLSDRDAALTLVGRLQRLAQAKGVSLRPPPPEPQSCCGRGCHGCVWEGYFAAVAYWRDEALLLMQD